MSHGVRTERSIVFYHGFTNSPVQFAELGRRFFQQGYNVYIPRYPYHGYLDRMTTALVKFTADELEATAITAAIVGAGLGGRLHVAGLSLGGLLAAWVGQNVAVSSATAIAPFFAIGRLPAALTGVVTRACALLPNVFLSWHPLRRGRHPSGPSHAYPRYPTRALAQQFLIGEEVSRAARRAAPRARVSVLFTNAFDVTVNNAAAERVYRNLERRGARVIRCRFTQAGAEHDLIDPFNARVPHELVDSRILELVEQADREAKRG
jgi:carboxylesterase